MKKNNRYLILIILTLVVVQGLTWATTGAIPTDDSAIEIAEQASQQPSELMSAIWKFATVMLAVMISSFLIFLGLTVWNAIVNRSRGQKVDYELKLNTPNSVDESILFFIHKNKMK